MKKILTRALGCAGAAALLFALLSFHRASNVSAQNTFCASNLACTVSALWNFTTNPTINGNSVTQTIANGTAALLNTPTGSTAITSGACASTVTVSASGVVTTDSIVYTPNVDPQGVTGYSASASGSLYIWAYPTSGNVNFEVCNNTGSSITPSALTLNWRVTR